MSLKKELRQKIFSKRKKVPLADREVLSLRALEKFIPLFEKYQPKICASYMPYNHEFDVVTINKFLEHQKVILAFPTIEVNEVGKQIMNFRKAGDMEYGYQNIIQPCLNNQIVMPDMIICPFVGVSTKNQRLGYGGGFYDQKTEDLNHAGYFPNLIAIGYQFQLIEEDFAEKHDITFKEVILLPCDISE